MSTLESTLPQHFQQAINHLPLVAILRGIRPTEVEACATMLYEEGFRLIEVPLNSPDAWTSISLLARCLPADALFGAGTVLKLQEVQQLRALKARLLVMPHTDVKLIAAANAGAEDDERMLCMPGVSTVSEAMAAWNAGAMALKMYPAEMINPAAFKAMRTVLPKQALLFPVGGIAAHNMRAYRQAGANGAGLGGSLYRAGMSLEELQLSARALIRAWKESAVV